MTLNIEEFQLSKLTTVSLCDAVDSLQNTSNKANRDFDLTESVLHVRANSYTRKVYNACNLKKEKLGKVYLSKQVTDFSEVLDEIKILPK